MAVQDVKSAWMNVGDELAAIGLKLKLHVEQGFDSDDEDSVRASLKRLTDAIEDTVDIAENVVKDPAIRADVIETGKRLADAVSVTFHKAQNDIRKS